MSQVHIHTDHARTLSSKVLVSNEKRSPSPTWSEEELDCRSIAQSCELLDQISLIKDAFEKTGREVHTFIHHAANAFEQSDRLVASHLSASSCPK